jgi:predicted transcriptional regulator
MLETVLGNRTAEKTLLYLANYEEGYAQAIANTFGVPIYAIQRQLQKFEGSGILASQLKGRTRIYVWNPRFALRKELLSLLQRALSLLPESEQKKYFRARARPRRAGKPL